MIGSEGTHRTREIRIAESIRISLFLWPCWFWAVAFLVPGSLNASDECPLVDPLLEHARAIKLHEDRYWWTLLHYKRTLVGTKSLVDDPAFFLSPEGKVDPASELEATIRVLFCTPPHDSESPICRFIARYAWLRERLDLSDIPHAEDACPLFKETIDRIQPRAATLVFPTAYLNSPASMFGHTLLRIETGYTNTLVSPAVNYSASTDETNGVVFAFKGIFGYYRGYFSILPYYEKVEEYNDIDQRDIWEYPLNLSEAEVRRMLLHLWELRSIFSYYYFFDENCSYTLLFLIEAARPGLDVTNTFKLWTIPMDTIRILEARGLIRGAQFRPSRASRIRHMSGCLDKEAQERVVAIVDGSMEPDQVPGHTFDTEEQQKTLDLAIEYLRYRYAKKKLAKDSYVPLFLRLLRARNRLGPSVVSVNEMPWPSDPLKGHLTNRIGISVGASHFGHARIYNEICYRPAYHDLLDNDQGYTEGSQIEFARVSLRYYPKEHRGVLQDLTLVNVTSLAPRDQFFKPLSWEVDTGLAREGPTPEREGLLYRLRVGLGHAYRSPLSGIWYYLAEADVNVGGRLEDHYAAGCGLSLGMLEAFGSSYKVHLFARALYYGFSAFHERIEVGVLQRLALHRNSNIQLRVVGKELRGAFPFEVSVRGSVYF